MPRDLPHDCYIREAPDFARPILTKLRKIVHKACPDVVETMKWSSPHFDHKGLLCGMAAFKAHVAFHIWSAKELEGADEVLDLRGKSKMGAVRIEKLSDIPAERVLVRLVKAAARLNEESGARPRAKTAKKTTRKKAAKRKIAVPDDLARELKRNKQAKATFEAFSPTNQKEYVEWLTEAKREATREKRLVTAIEWMNEGKPRNWKYMQEWR